MYESESKPPPLFIILIAIIIILMMLSVPADAQRRVSLQVSTDLKLTVLGDDHNDIKSGLNNVLIKSRWMGNQQKNGYMYIAPSYEYAALTDYDYEGNLIDTPYNRYCVELGYVFNKLITDVGLGLYADYGIIERGSGGQSYGFGGTVTYKIIKRVKVISTLQFANRVDFQWTGEKIPAKIRYSVFAGLEFDLTN